MENSVTRIKALISSILSWICIVIFVFMTILGTYQIVTRYVFNSPSTISEELLTYLFTWLALFSATDVFGHREHMRMGFFADRLSENLRFALDIFSELLICAFSLIVLVYGGISITKLTFSQVTASLGISMGTVYLVVPICGVLTALFSLINIYLLFKGRENK